MPVDWSKYPDNWKDIAFAVKQEAYWRCQVCGLQCRFPDQRKGRAWTQHNTLTVAHLNHQPSDCSDSNLVAMCPTCHLRYDARRKAKTRRAKPMNESQCYAVVGLIDVDWWDRAIRAENVPREWRAARRVYAHFDERKEAVDYLKKHGDQWREEEGLPDGTRLFVSVVNRPKRKQRDEDLGQGRLLDGWEHGEMPGRSE